MKIHAVIVAIWRPAAGQNDLEISNFPNFARYYVYNVWMKLKTSDGGVSTESKRKKKTNILNT